jgi:hypothetical protein
MGLGRYAPTIGTAFPANSSDGIAVLSPIGAIRSKPCSGREGFHLLKEKEPEISPGSFFVLSLKIYGWIINSKAVHAWGWSIEGFPNRASPSNMYLKVL